MIKTWILIKLNKKKFFFLKDYNFIIIKNFKLKKIKFKLRLFSKMFKIKKYNLFLKPLVHLSNLFFLKIPLVKFKYKKKKKFLKFYSTNKIFINFWRTFVNKRIVDKYTKRGFFLNYNLLLKK